MPKNLGQVTIYSGQLTADETQDFSVPSEATGARFWLEVVRNGADPDETLDVKFRIKSPSGTYYDMPEALFAQITTSDSDQMLVIHEGQTATANKKDADMLSKNMQVVFDLGGTTPDYTIALYAEWLA